MKKLFLLLFFLPIVSFAYKTTYFEISMDSPYKVGNTIDVELNKDTLPENIESINLFVGDKSLEKLANSAYPDYKFKITKDLNVDNRSLALKIVYQNGDHQDFVLPNVKIPYFNSVDAVDAKGGEKLKINYDFSGDCDLIIGDKKLSISDNNGFTYVNIPDNLSEPVNGGYLLCDGLASNYKSFYIPASPKLIYMKTEDGKKLVPGSTLLVYGKNIKLDSTDEIEVLLNNKSISYNFVDDNTLKIKLPYKNYKNASIQVIRNEFKSNKLIFSALKYPVILNVSTNYTTNDGAYFEIYGNFDTNLGEPVVKYGTKKLNIISYRKISPTLTLIKAEFPTGEIKPSNIVVNIDGVDSNSYFYNLRSDLTILGIDSLQCKEGGSCQFRVHLNKILGKDTKVLLNGSDVQFVNGSNTVLVTPRNFYYKGDIQIVSNGKFTNIAHYDFTNYFKPKVYRLISDKKFTSYSDITVQGDKLTRDSYHLPEKMNVKVSFNPSIVESGSLKIGYSNIDARLIEVNEGDKIKVSISNVNGKANDAYFTVGVAKEFLANPVIEKVSYPDGGKAGKQAIIEGYAFSDNCNEDEIYFGNKVVYPTDCSFSKLVFNIPDWSASSIYLKVNGNSSNKYDLGTLLGATPIFDNISFNTLNIGKTLNPSSSKVELPFKITNPTTSLFIPVLKFKLHTNDGFIPADDFVLKINGDDSQYFLDNYSNNLYKLSSELDGQLVKEGDDYYLEFYNVYIPYSSEPIQAEIDFSTSPTALNNQLFEIYSPSNLDYQNVFNLTYNHINIDSSLLGKYVFNNLVSICVDSDSSYKNCALVLKGVTPKIENDKFKKPEEIKKQTISQNKPKSTIEKQTTKPLTKEEKIANKLTLDKMKLLNKVLFGFIKQMKDKYWNNKEKLKYIVEMYRGYKQMEANTSDSMDSKINYVKGLIYFAQNYFSFIKLK